MVKWKCSHRGQIQIVLQLMKLRCSLRLGHPVDVERLRNDFYVDNLLSGAETKQEATDLVQQMMKLLKAGWLTLRKWVANDPELLSDIPVAYNHRELQEIVLDVLVATLSLLWNPLSDDFRSKTVEYDSTRKLTKRQFCQILRRCTIHCNGWPRWQSTRKC